MKGFVLSVNSVSSWRGCSGGGALGGALAGVPNGLNPKS